LWNFTIEPQPARAHPGVLTAQQRGQAQFAFRTLAKRGWRGIPRIFFLWCARRAVAFIGISTAYPSALNNKVPIKLKGYFHLYRHKVEVYEFC
jgi:hypothetical protein